jgi:broad specificity phosphatase PhoE
MSTTTLVLVRHGETAWNAEGRVQGQTDVPLNEVGRAQAAALVPVLAAERFAAIYSSDLQRLRRRRSSSRWRWTPACASGTTACSRR